MNLNIAVGLIQIPLVLANIFIVTERTGLNIAAITFGAFAAGWCLAFGINQAMRKRYGY